MILEHLAKICARAPATRLAAVLPYLNQAMSEAEINTPGRVSAFVAQLAHESGEFRYSEEIASGDAYEGRKDLGNTHSGDGRRFKGRGFIQVTGRSNYAAAGKALGLDLEQNPERAAQYDTAARVAAWFWKAHGLNQLADAGDLEHITRRINGGLNGQAQRLAYYQRALTVLGVTGTRAA